MEGQQINKKSAFAIEVQKRLDLGLVATEEIKRLGRIDSERRIKLFSKPTHEEQLAQEMKFANDLRKMNITMQEGELDSQILYEEPIPFLQLMFGSHLKLSCCYFKDESMTIDEAEVSSLELYCERAQIKDGQSVIDVGCGYGSFVIYVAQNYKNCHVVGLTNSASQKDFIESKIKELGLSNLKTILADAATYETEETFDRVVAIELIEHMRNYELLFRKLSKWLSKSGLLFLEHASHKTFSQLMERIHEDEWSIDYGLPPGTLIMPSTNLLLYFQEDLSVVNHWVLNGKHYSRTFEEWSKRLNANMEVAKAILEKSLGREEDAIKMLSFWKKCTGHGSLQFRFNNGEEYMITHFLFKKK